jgi:predicted RNA-binding protein with PUA-like domain
MNYWLMKTEPETFSFDDLLKDGKTHWDGVRNHQAQNNMKAMRVGDQVLIYHSVSEKAVVGIGKISKTAYPDPTAAPGEKWIAVEVQPVKKLPKPITLQTIKNTPALSDIALIRQSRLSVMPLSKNEVDQILALGQ